MLRGYMARNADVPYSSEFNIINNSWVQDIGMITGFLVIVLVIGFDARLTKQICHTCDETLYLSGVHTPFLLFRTINLVATLKVTSSAPPIY
jgi:hypothetical protein